MNKMFFVLAFLHCSYVIAHPLNFSKGFFFFSTIVTEPELTSKKLCFKFSLKGFFLPHSKVTVFVPHTDYSRFHTPAPPGPLTAGSGWCLVTLSTHVS